MDEREVADRIEGKRREEVEGGEISLWYLSFSDGAFRGACFVSAFGMIDAIEQAHLLGINPGGNVAAAPVSPDAAIPEGARRRLLSKDDLVMYFGEVEVVRR